MQKLNAPWIKQETYTATQSYPHVCTTTCHIYRTVPQITVLVNYDLNHVVRTTEEKERKIISILLLICPILWIMRLQYITATILKTKRWKSITVWHSILWIYYKEEKEKEDKSIKMDKIFFISTKTQMKKIMSKAATLTNHHLWIIN